MTYRCERCAVNWAPYQTRGGQCAGCGSGTKRITGGVPDADAAERYRMILQAEADLERKLTLYLRFDEFYDREWPALRSPEVAAEAARWAA